MAGHVVGVVVGLEHMIDLDAEVAGQLEVLTDLEAWIDHCDDAGGVVADEVGRTAQVVVGDLAKDHKSILSGTAKHENQA